MAKPVSEEELQLQKRARRRLIGAIALVAVIAAVLPMVLDSEPKATSQEVSIQIPSPDAKGSFTGKGLPAPGGIAAVKGGDAKDSTPSAPAVSKDVLPDPGASAEKPSAKAAEKASEKAAERPAEKVAERAADKAPAKGAEKSTEKAAEKAVEKSADKPPATKPGPGTFYIQVTALADTEKVKQVQRQIADAGLRSYTEVVAAGAGKVTRVRAGPFTTRDEAEQARAKLATAGLEGKVASQ